MLGLLEHYADNCSCLLVGKRDASGFWPAILVLQQYMKTFVDGEVVDFIAKTRIALAFSGRRDEGHHEMVTEVLP